MKISKIISISVLFLCLISCKKKYDSAILGPEIITNAQLVEPFALSSPQADFSSTNTRVSFQGKFSTKVKWKISIVGNESFAEKHFMGISDTIPSNILWDGAQDSLYYFYANENCTVTLSIDKSFNANYISDNLNTRGNIPTNDVVLATEIIKIVKTKRPPSTQLEVFPRFRTNPYFTTKKAWEMNLSKGLVGYDQEDGAMEDRDSDIPFLNQDKIDTEKPVVHFIFEDPAYVPLSKTKGGIRGKEYYMLKGTDRTSKLFTGVPDYYIGRMASLNIASTFTQDDELDFYFGTNIRNILKTKNVDEIYLNVFVYGNGDGSTINYTLKQDAGSASGPTLDNRYEDNFDESFEKPIKVDFLGWKLFSFRYSDFTPALFKSEGNETIEGKKLNRGDLRKGLYARQIHDHTKLLVIQFGLVGPATAKGPGGSGRAIIDNPVISWDGPLKY